jgi:hypothetical protein
MGSNPVRRGGKPATNGLGYGTAIYRCKSIRLATNKVRQHRTIEAVKADSQYGYGQNLTPKS